MLDLEEIINSKVKEMLENGAIENKIKEKIEDVVLNSFDELFARWSDFNKVINQKLKDEVSPAVQQIGFSGLKESLIFHLNDQISAIADEGAVKKSRKALEELVLKQYNDITIYDLYEDYKKYLSNNLEYDDFEDGEYLFIFDFNWIRNDYYELLISNEDEAKPRRIKAGFYNWDFYKGTIPMATLEIDGHNIDTCYNFSHFNKFELKLISLYFNKKGIKTGNLEDIDEFDNVIYYEG